MFNLRTYSQSIEDKKWDCPVPKGLLYQDFPQQKGQRTFEKWDNIPQKDENWNITKSSMKFYILGMT